MTLRELINSVYTETFDGEGVSGGDKLPLPLFNLHCSHHRLTLTCTAGG